MTRMANPSGDATNGMIATASKLVELFVRSLEAGEFDPRIRALEETTR
jgi:hypothetical protein